MLNFIYPIFLLLCFTTLLLIKNTADLLFSQPLSNKKRTQSNANNIESVYSFINNQLLRYSKSLLFNLLQIFYEI